MSLFQNRYSKEEISNQISQKQKAIPFTTEYSGIPKDYILLPGLLIVVFILLPVWTIWFAPFVLGYLLYKGFKSMGKILFSSSEYRLEESAIGEFGSDLGLASDIIPFESRKYDIVVFGVTGHSGSLLAEYLIERYIKNGNTLKIAVAGRSFPKVTNSLEKIAKNIDYPQAVQLPVIVADSKDQNSLYAMARNTRVISTTVGPFLKYGEPVVRACARYGTSYNDITGENDFVQQMRAKYGSLARASGASIVSTTGVDSIPSDIGVLNVVRKFKERFNKDPERVDNLIESALGGVAGGTIDTFLQYLDVGPPPKYTLTNREVKGVLSQDPFYGLGYNRLGKVWTFPYIMAPINTKVVESTNISLGHTPRLHYNEAMIVPSIIANILFSLTSVIFSSIVFFYPTRCLLFKAGILPKPGVGPSRKFMARGFFSQKLIASTTDGLKEEVKFRFVGDPGGMLTALLQAEVAVSLSTRKTTVLTTGAGLTPGETLDSVAFTKTLNDTGLINFE